MPACTILVPRYLVLKGYTFLISKLEAVARGEIKRLLVTMPPGSAKSTYASVLFPVWFLAQRPHLSLIAASHTSELAEQFSRRLMGLIRQHADVLDYALSSESVASWMTTTGGQYVSIGVGGAIAGRRADLALIDDPIKNRAQADSPTERERIWSWFNSDLRTRLRPGAPIILIQTRWHEDDLAGRLIQSQSDQWDIACLPAIAGEDDPLGRKPGEFLWHDDDYGYGGELMRVLSDYEATGAMRDWTALFQQNPRPAEGGLFKVQHIKRIDAVPDKITKILRGWDIASTGMHGSRHADWTVGLKLGRTEGGQYIILDVRRVRGDPAEVEALIVNTAQQDGTNVQIALSQDPAQAGRWQAQHLVSKLAGFSVTAARESGDKSTRASPVASQINIGNVSMVSGSWNAAFIDELSGFPSSKWDDQVDALSKAFNSMAPVVKGEAMLILAARELRAMRGQVEEPVNREEDDVCRWQPGSAEHTRWVEERRRRGQQ